MDNRIAYKRLKEQDFAKFFKKMQLFPDSEDIDVQYLGNGYDSTAFLVNNEYVFKIKHSANEKKGYKKEKEIYDFLNKNLNTNVKVPNIEFSQIDNEVSILGYKIIKGDFLTPKLYTMLSEEEKEQLKQDLARFLKTLHNLDTTEISEYAIDNKQNVLEEYQLLRNTIYDSFTRAEKAYIENFMQKLLSTNIFDGKKCLCHNDFSSNHLLLNDKRLLCGVIDFGDSGVTDEYCDFIYLLGDDGDEIMSEFGEDVLKIYGDIDVYKAKEYQKMTKKYRPIETIVYGIKNNRRDFVNKGKAKIAKAVS